MAAGWRHTQRLLAVRGKNPEWHRDPGVAFPRTASARRGEGGYRQYSTEAQSAFGTASARRGHSPDRNGLGDGWRRQAGCNAGRMRRGSCHGLLSVAAAVTLVLGLATSDATAQSNTGKTSFSAGADFSHAYYFRGIKQERSGIIAQPYMDMTFTLFEGDVGLNSVTFTIGQWNSLHTGPTGNAGPAANAAAWYESDFYTGLGFGIDNWDFGVAYTAYLSPNDSFGSVKELALSLAVDDSALLGGLALSPHGLLAIEVDGQADGGAGEGVYLEVGVEPGLSVDGTPVSVSFPVTLGMSLTDYYEETPGNDDMFGYLDLGLVASAPLPVPESYGTWGVSGGIHLLSLKDTLTAFNGGDEFQAVVTFGFSVAY